MVHWNWIKTGCVSWLDIETLYHTWLQDDPVHSCHADLQVLGKQFERDRTGWLGDRNRKDEWDWLNYQTGRHSQCREPRLSLWAGDSEAGMGTRCPLARNSLARVLVVKIGFTLRGKTRPERLASTCKGVASMVWPSTRDCQRTACEVTVRQPWQRESGHLITLTPTARMESSFRKQLLHVIVVSIGKVLKWIQYSG